jgi:Na+/H+ antiporter NhaD/arsenite permease-like protein
MSAEVGAPVPWKRYAVFAAVFAVVAVFALLRSSGALNAVGPTVGLFGKEVPIIPLVIFGCTLGGLTVGHKYNLEIALSGLATLALYSVYVGQIKLGAHTVHEAPALLNLAMMLAGFAVLAKLFEESGVAEIMPRWLYDDWRGGAQIILGVSFLSAFLDNIAACLIGGVIARKVYKGKVSVAFVASLVMASNLGGAHSPIGDTTTIMMVNSKIPIHDIFPSIPGVIMGTLMLAYFAGKKQEKYQHIQEDGPTPHMVDEAHKSEAGGVRKNMLVAVGITLVCVIAGTLAFHATGMGVFVGLFISWVLVARKDMPWREAFAHDTLRGAIFLSALVASASLMPKALPEPSAPAEFGLGILSAIFDNIPLTELAIRAGGFNWALLAFCVGVGGSMTTFGSSAAVALLKDPAFEKARDLKTYIKEGWILFPTYCVGFAVIMGWEELCRVLNIAENPFLWAFELALFLAFGLTIYITRQKPKMEKVEAGAETSPTS